MPSEAGVGQIAKSGPTRGILPDPGKITAVQHFPIPSCVKALRITRTSLEGNSRAAIEGKPLWSVRWALFSQGPVRETGSEI